MFVKLNPFWTKDELNAYGLTCFDENLYEEDGVLRLRQLETGVWRKQFEENFEILRYLEFLYPWQEGLNRLFLLKKKEKE